MEKYNHQTYLEEVEFAKYESSIPPEMFRGLSDEGWLLDLENYFKCELNRNDFSYIELRISDKDRRGLINFNKMVVEKFNDFDIKIKCRQKFPFTTLDFIDYKNGKIFIIRLMKFR